MADELKINVALTEEVNKAQSIHQKLINSPNYSKENQSKVAYNQAQLQNILKKDQITSDDLKTFRKLHKEIVSILTDVLLKEKQVTASFTKSLQKVQQIADQAEAARERLSKLQKKGTITDRGVSLKSTYIADYLQGITYTSGRHKGEQVQAGSFWQEGNRTNFSGYSDPQKAQKIYQHLQAVAARLPQDFEQAVNAVNTLEKALQEAQRASEKLQTTGDQKTALSLASSQDAVNQLVTKGINAQQEQKEQDYKSQELAQFNKDQEKNNSIVGRALKNFSLYAIVLRTTKKVIQEVRQTITQLDKSLTEQAMVTGLTRQQTYKLLQSYQELAIQTGATTKEVAGVATEYMKQGKSISEALTLTQAAVSAAKIAGISTEDSVNYLTTALNGFRLSAEDAMSVSDKFAAVAASSATDYNELATALSKVASQANLAGMSIDYTTALLAKGLETTREAPETMGTALKTIIARMREMSDYGATLEGDTDVNNVETQLAYVDIALKNTNGELRSTENVLDELGRKWNTLNTNQQAAIAKALAGTRQQSRLIAMMDDYERVIELQQISARSVGATSAQAATYLEGLEARINKVNVAVEKLISTLGDTDAIQKIVDLFGNLLEGVNSILNNSVELQIVLTAVSALVGQMVINKSKQLIYSMQERKLQKEITKEETKLKLVEQQQLVAKKQAAVEETKKLITAKEITSQAKKQSIYNNTSLTQEQKNVLIKEEELALAASTTADREKLAQQESELKIESLKLIEIQKESLSLGLETNTVVDNMAIGVSSIGGGVLSLITGSQIWLGVLTAIVPVVSTIGKLIDINRKKQEQENKTTLTGALLTAVKSAFTENFWIGAAIAAIAGIAAIAAISNKISKTTSGQDNAKQIQSLNKEIYDLTKRAESMETIVSKFDSIDEQIIKTNDDLKEMNSLLTSASDNLDNTTVKNKDDIGYGRGINQQQAYEALKSNIEKRNFLEEEALKTQQKIQQDYLKAQKQIIQLRKKGQLENYLSGSSEEARAVRDNIYGYNNLKMYNQLDKLVEQGIITSEESSSIETWTQQILENIDAAKAEQLSNDNTIEQLTELIAKTKLLTTETEDYANIINILSSNDYSLTEQVQAYTTLLQTISDPDVKESFKEIYNSLETYTTLNQDTLTFLDKVGLTAEKINTLNTGYKKLDATIISQEQYQSRVLGIIQDLAASDGDISTVLHLQFDDLLSGLDEETWTNTWTSLVNIMEDVLGTGITNMGQLIEKEFSRINNFYEKSAEWSSMKTTDRMSFIQENADLFAGAEGEAMLKAFETGDYNLIQQALKSNTYLQKQRESLLQKAEMDLTLELAKSAEEQNKSYIAILKQYITELNNIETFYQADLETRLNKENSQLEEFKNMLEAQQEAVEDSLNKRREAYEKYYEAIDQQEEDSDYEEEALKLQTNLTKISSSTDASALSMRKQLEQSLKNLEEERLKTLRERAQEAVLNSMDDELSQISDKFDDVLNNQQALLTLFNKELENPSAFLTNLISSIGGNGKMTQLQLDNWLKGFKTTYSGLIDSSILDSITARTDGSSGNLTINIGGEEVINVAQKDARALADALKEAIKQYGGGIVSVRK